MQGSSDAVTTAPRHVRLNVPETTDGELSWAFSVITWRNFNANQHPESRIALAVALILFMARGRFMPRVRPPLDRRVSLTPLLPDLPHLPPRGGFGAIVAAAPFAVFLRP